MILIKKIYFRNKQYISLKHTLRAGHDTLSQYPFYPTPQFATPHPTSYPPHS